MILPALSDMVVPGVCFSLLKISLIAWLVPALQSNVWVLLYIASLQAKIV